VKRNKPIVKTRAAGTQHKKRREAGYFGWRDYERGVNDWRIVVAQSVVGDTKTFSMDGAVPAGEDGNPDDPAWKGVFRWRLDRDGKEIFVYSTPPSGTTDKFVVFTAERKCDRGDNCPMVRYWSTDIDFTLSRHRPGNCPMAVPGPGAWRRKGMYEPFGRGL